MECIAKSIKLEQMDKYQLSQLNQQLVSDIDCINANIKRVVSELDDNKEKLTILQTLRKSETKTTNAIVPLTPTLSIKGDIEYNGRVIVHVGDQYYVSKKIEKAIEFYQIKIRERTSEKESYEIVLNDRQSILSKMEQLVKKMVSLQTKNN